MREILKMEKWMGMDQYLIKKETYYMKVNLRMADQMDMEK